MSVSLELLSTLITHTKKATLTRHSCIYGKYDYVVSALRLQCVLRAEVIAKRKKRYGELGAVYYTGLLFP